MNLDLAKFNDEIKELCKDLTSNVDARSIIRRKPFVINENDKVERIININADGSIEDFKNGSFTSEVKMDSHVSAILRLKETVISNVIPFVGEPVVASHVDISSLRENSRIKVIEVNKDFIVLEKQVTIPARSFVRLMDLQRAVMFAIGTCRCCKAVKKVPLFHGVEGYCRECNEGIIRPTKAEFGGYLQGLLNKGMYYEEAHDPRSFSSSEIESISRAGGKTIIRVKGEILTVVRNFQTGQFVELLKRFPSGSTFKIEGEYYIIDGFKCYIMVENWAKGLATKIKELRIDKNTFLTPKEFEGVFLEKEDYGDQTLRHMRRMFNIAKSKFMMDKRIRNEDDAIECVEKAFLIMNQPDCSRKLHTIISKHLTYATQMIHKNNDLDSEIMQKIIGIMTSIEVGLANTAEAHEEEGH